MPYETETTGHEEVKDAKRPEEQASFNPTAYLTDFYKDVSDMDAAMLVILSYMPGLAARILPCSNMLDVGSGPTIHMAMIFRNRVDNIFLSDYSQDNIAFLDAWRRGEGTFDWAPAARKIALHECYSQPDTQRMEEQTRSKVRHIYRCDVFDNMVLLDTNCVRGIDGGLDVVTTVFCLEYAGTTADSYRTALKNVAGLVKSGGWLVMGGVLEDNYYEYNYTRYQCHYLTESELMSGLEEYGIATTGPDYVYLRRHGTFVFLGRKKKKAID